MTMRSRTVLSPSLAAKLATLAYPRENRDHELKTIIAQLSALPASIIVRASSEIAMAAQLGWYPLMHRLASGFGGEPIYVRDLALMRRNPDYAWIFLFHPSGHVREAALDTLQTPPDSPFFLSALVWRLNDWVEPVRRAAARYLQRVQLQISPEVAASSAPYLFNRRHAWGRWRSEADLLDEIFGRPDVLPILVGFLQQTANGPLAGHLRHALRYPGIDRYLPTLAATAIQPQVRAVAYRCLLTGSVSWFAGFERQWIDKVYGISKRIPKFERRPLRDVKPSPELFWRAARDGSVVVRRAAADALIAASVPLPEEDRLIAFFEQDKNPSVRSRGDFLRRRTRTA